jgi:hypothetical protein
MNPTEIEFAVRALVAEPYDPAKFVFDLVAIYNAPKVTVSKLKNGQTNATKAPGDVLWKKHLYFRTASVTDDVASIGDELALDPLTVKHSPRFILVTNGDQVHIRDRQLDDTCNTEFSRLDESSDFLLPLAGYERRAAATENPADVKAAKRLAKLYDAILAANPTWSDGNHTHELNLFMTRILFCFYAEDTGIFDVPQLLTNTVAQHTTEAGADVAPLLDRLFTVMNQRDDERPASISSIDNRFPYVNGSLFENTLSIPTFNRTARRLFLECGELDWRTINPDIFGSMIQTIVEPGARGALGMHYTSVPNIMKVLQPLFLDDLNEAYDKAKDSVAKLQALLARLSTIRVFDPACGSGNFLLISYKELRQLEMRALFRISELAPNNPLRLSGISLHNFYGIDIVDFACETAKLSLWIAEYQMNSAFKELFGTARPPLPLGKIGTLHNGNALRLDWLSICPNNPDAETYICGNPPYSGSVGQTVDQKADIAMLFASHIKNYKDIDYVACFFLKAAEYLNTTPGQSAFVATNSICQGEQVAMLWPLIYALNVEIVFAYPSFIWKNNASYNAWVICIIVGLSRVGAKQTKTLYIGEHTTRVSTIGPYLVPGTSLIIRKASRQISALPAMAKGNMPSDGGKLILSPDERDHLLSRYPQARHLIRSYLGSEDFINSLERYCLWITDDDLSLANSLPDIKARIGAVRKTRSSGGSQARGAAHTPHRFVFISHRDAAALIVPEVSAERRQYLQIGVLSNRDIASNTVYVIYDPPAYLLALLSSRLFRIWAGTVGGKMRHHTRVSNSLVYNTYSVPTLSAEQKRILADHSRAILKARAKHPDKTIAWLYNPDTMPQNLLEAHQANDAYLEEYVYGRKFRDDSHRLEHLFAMYARMKEQTETPSLLSASREKASA